MECKILKREIKFLWGGTLFHALQKDSVLSSVEWNSRTGMSVEPYIITGKLVDTVFSTLPAVI